MEVDAAIQDERAVNLISTQVDAVDDQDVVVLAAGVDEGHEHDEVDGELAVEVGADGRDVPAVGPAGEELGLCCLQRICTAAMASLAHRLTLSQGLLSTPSTRLRVSKAPGDAGPRLAHELVDDTRGPGGAGRR